jgi:hypothetical protein
MSHDWRMRWRRARSRRECESAPRSPRALSRRGIEPRPGSRVARPLVISRISARWWSVARRPVVPPSALTSARAAWIDPIRVAGSGVAARLALIRSSADRFVKVLAACRWRSTAPEWFGRFQADRGVAEPGSRLDERRAARTGSRLYIVPRALPLIGPVVRTKAQTPSTVLTPSWHASCSSDQVARESSPSTRPRERRPGWGDRPAPGDDPRDPRTRRLRAQFAKSPVRLMLTDVVMPRSAGPTWRRASAPPGPRSEWSSSPGTPTKPWAFPGC